MATGRIILRSLGTSRKFAQLGDLAGKLGEFAQALFPLLITHADDFGRMAGDAFTVKHAVWPTAKRADVDFDAALSAMHAAGLIVRYTVGDDIFIQVNKFDDGQQGLHKRTQSKFPEVPGDSGNFREFPSDTIRTDTIRRDTKGREGSGREPVSPDGDALPSPEAVASVWNDGIQGTDLPRVEKMSPPRIRAVRALSQEHPDRAWWTAYVARIVASDFLAGRSGRTAEHQNWRPDLDWALKPQTVAKVLEGKYDNRAAQPPPNGGRTSARTAGNLAALDRFIARGEQQETPRGQLPES